MKAVAAWEEMANSNTGGHVRYKDFRVVFDSKLEAVHTDALLVEEVLGNLWPAALYEAHFKTKAPARGKLTTVCHKGQQIREVLMDPNKG